MSKHTIPTELNIAPRGKSWLHGQLIDGDHGHPTRQSMESTERAQAIQCTCPSGDGSLHWPCPAHPPTASEASDERKDLVPGVMRCAKCEFQLVRQVLAVNLGEIFAGDSKTEPCPNGCGPLWPVTWKQYAEQAMDAAETMADRAFAAEKEVKLLRGELVQHSDEVAVDALASLMKAKLAKQRDKGYGGWDDTECSQQHLSNLLRGHVDKGDPVDVANFCAFLSARGEGISPQAAPAAVAATASPTFMTADQGRDWAWNNVREYVGTEGWTVMDSVNFHGFFLYGWNYRGQYELQRTAAVAAVKQELTAAPVAAGEREDMQDMVSKALTTAWQLGQTFWRQADSVRHTQHVKSEQTERDFEALIESTRAALAATPAADVPTGYVRADQAYSVLQLHEDLQDVWSEANAVDTVIGRPDALMKKLTRIRDAVANAANGYLPIAPAAVAPMVTTIPDAAYCALQYVEHALAAIANREELVEGTIERVDTIGKASKRAKAALTRLQAVAHHFNAIEESPAAAAQVVLPEPVGAIAWNRDGERPTFHAGCHDKELLRSRLDEGLSMGPYRTEFAFTEPQVRALLAGVSAPAAQANTPDSFREWFAKNYPADTIILDPDWHAKSIFRMAQAHARLSAPQAQADARDAEQEVLMEHSGCGSNTQVDMLTVRLNPGDKVVMHKGRMTQGFDRAKRAAIAAQAAQQGGDKQ